MVVLVPAAARPVVCPLDRDRGSKDTRTRTYPQ